MEPIKVLVLSDYSLPNRYWVDKVLSNLPRPPFQPLYSNNIDSVQSWLAEDSTQFKAVIINPDQGQWPKGVNQAEQLAQIMDPSLIWIVSRRYFFDHELRLSQQIGFHCHVLNTDWAELKTLFNTS